MFWHDVREGKPPKRISKTFSREKGYENKQDFFKDLNVQLKANEKEKGKKSKGNIKENIKGNIKQKKRKMKGLDH